MMVYDTLYFLESALIKFQKPFNHKTELYEFVAKSFLDLKADLEYSALIPKVNVLLYMPEASVAIKNRCLERVLFNKVMALFHMTVMYHHSLEVNPQLPEIECLTSKPELKKALEKQFSEIF